jgi:hypothetical protein
LGPIHLYAHLAVHALKHSCNRLTWLVDMALLLPGTPIPALCAWSRANGADRAVELSLHLLRRLLGQEISHQLRPPTLLENGFLGLVARGRQPRIAGEVLTALTLPSWRERWSYLRDLFFPQSTATRSQRLGELYQAARAEWRRLRGVRVD